MRNARQNNVCSQAIRHPVTQSHLQSEHRKSIFVKRCIARLVSRFGEVPCRSSGTQKKIKKKNHKYIKLLTMPSGPGRWFGNRYSASDSFGRFSQSDCDFVKVRHINTTLFGYSAAAPCRPPLHTKFHRSASAKICAKVLRRSGNDDLCNRFVWGSTDATDAIEHSRNIFLCLPFSTRFKYNLCWKCYLAALYVPYRMPKYFNMWGFSSMFLFFLNFFRSFFLHTFNNNTGLILDQRSVIQFVGCLNELDIFLPTLMRHSIAPSGEYSMYEYICFFIHISRNHFFLVVVKMLLQIL